jgi:hypothetical protein
LKPRNGVLLTVTFADGSEATYPSIAEAARKLGINRQEINRYLSGVYKKCRRGWTFKAE